MGYDVTLVDAIRSALARTGDPERAARQQAYMKSTMPFHGISAPELRRIVTPLLRQQAPGIVRSGRHLVVTGAWWDPVDQIATRLVGPVLLAHRRSVAPVLDAWSVEDDLWLRRVAVLAQLKHRGDTDTALLERVVVAALDGSAYGREFFIRKAIGWALREHVKTDPVWVLALVDRYADQLSPLSRREATKHLG